MKALASPEEARYAAFVTRQVDSVSTPYENLPSLQYKTETIRTYLAELLKKNAT
jgi:hypothetical protein